LSGSSAQRHCLRDAQRRRALGFTVALAAKIVIGPGAPRARRSDRAPARRRRRDPRQALPARVDEDAIADR
jgi:hypothetical protein